jgi:cytochrome c-type biogenesis protein
VDPAALAFALVAGAVAAFNPCGFALLPAYLGLIVTGPDERSGASARAVRFAAGMTVGFVGVFGLVGVVLAPLALSLERYLPVVTVIVGVLLVGLGVRLLAGHELAISGLAGHGRAPTARWRSQIGYGASFALASLSCTIAPFLAVTAGSLRAGGPVGVAAVFVAYALGMGVVVLVLALAVAAARSSAVRVLRRTGAAVGRAGGVLLVVAGAYVTWYGWFEIRSIAGDTASDPVVAAAVGVQAAIAGWIADLGPATLLLVGALLTVGLAVAALRRQRRRSAELRPG